MPYPVAAVRGKNFVRTLEVPLQIGGVQLWLAADKITGLSDGGAVGTWLDSSGNGNNATEATNKPTYQTNELNGLPIVRFDATNDTLATAAIDLTGTDSVTLFLVYKFTESGTKMLASTGNANNMTDSFETYSDGTDMWTFGKGDVGFISSGEAYNSNNWAIQCNTLNKGLSSDEAKIWINNTAGTTGSDSNNTNAFGNRQFWLNAREGTSLYAGMDCAEVILYDTALSDANRQLIQNYLSSKYNITLS